MESKYIVAPEKALADLLANKPKLHHWKETWKYGGLNNEMLKQLFNFAFNQRDGNKKILETGAGLSTLVFLIGRPNKLITIAPSDELRQRIEKEKENFGLNSPSHDFYIDRSENVLPDLAKTDRRLLDFALIDGGHGLPTVFVDFCYINKILKNGGHFGIDDIQLPSVRQLFLLIKNQPGFELVEKISKLAIFKKTTNAQFLPDFGKQPFVAEARRYLP